ncbi:hypothetical protein COOONC_11796, partial [Cooperia oncophora]
MKSLKNALHYEKPLHYSRESEEVQALEGKSTVKEAALSTVKADCSSILEEFGISWPEPLDCSRFPQEPDLCMNPDEDRHSYEK